MSDLETTPLHEVKPRLEWIGRILGMDVYVDTSGEHPDKRKLAENVLGRALKKLDNNGTSDNN